MGKESREIQIGMLRLGKGNLRFNRWLMETADVEASVRQILIWKSFAVNWFVWRSIQKRRLWQSVIKREFIFLFGSRYSFWLSTCLIGDRTGIDKLRINPEISVLKKIFVWLRKRQKGREFRSVLESMQVLWKHILKIWSGNGRCYGHESAMYHVKLLEQFLPLWYCYFAEGE